jgi:two-component system sensor kinase FixL
MFNNSDNKNLINSQPEVVTIPWARLFYLLAIFAVVVVIWGLYQVEIISVIFVLLMVAAAFIYTGKIKQQIEAAASEKELFISELQTAKNALQKQQDELELTVQERTSELTQVKEFTENIISSMADMLIAVDDEGIIVNVNDEFLNQMGYPESEVIGQDIKFITQKDSFLTDTEYEKLKADRKLVQIEKEFVRKNGETFIGTVSTSILKNFETAAVVVVKDISKLKEDERKLQVSVAELEKSKCEYEELTDLYKQINEELRTKQVEVDLAHNFTNKIMDSMVDFVVVVGMDLIIQRVNPAALKLNGYQEEELIGQSVNLLMADRPYTEKGIDLLRKVGFISNIDKLNRCKDGTIIPISLSMSILRDEAGNECGIVCVGKDNTEILKARKSIEESNEKLRQSNRELQDFAYVASHDLQEPLRKVQAFGDRLNRKFADQLGEEGSDYVRRMREASGRMQTLINDLLTFSRVSTKAQPFQKVDIETITKEVVSDLEVRIEETKGKIEIGELPRINADPVQMRQLMQNLLGNALKFHNPNQNPVIKVYSAETIQQNTGSFRIDGQEIQTQGLGEKFCQIVVQDNGIGFDEKYLDRIFTVFQRLHGRSEYEGSGVGLAVCRKIVERHGGNITAQSKVGNGSTFLITLPINQDHKENIYNEN